MPTQRLGRQASLHRPRCPAPLGPTSRERRGGLSRPGAQGQQNGNGAAAPATSVSVGELLPSSMALPGMSNGGVSGLSFML